MAAPGIGYVKRDVDKTTIDWSAVSSSITGALGEAFTEAQKQRAEVELKNQKMAADIQDLPAGATPDQSKYYASIIQNVGDANQKIKEQYDNGEISPNQYKIATNSLNTQYQILKNNLLNYQSSYDKLLERINKEGTGNVSIFLGSLQDTLGNLANKSIGWNPETMILESKTIVDGKLTTQPVTNDLAIMNFYNKKFDTKAITNANNAFAKKVFETVDAEGNVTYSANYKSKEFEGALNDYVNSKISDANGIQALEYLTGPGGKRLVYDTPKSDDELQLLIDEKGRPIAANLSEIVKQAKDGLKKDIIASLDTTYRTKEGGKQFEIDFIPNKEITMGLVSGVKTVDDYVNHLDRFKPGTYLSKSEMAKSSQPFKVIINNTEQVVSAAEYVKSRPEATFFEIDKQGRPRPVVLNTFEDFFSFANQAAGMNDKQISAFRKKEQGRKYFVENGEIKFDTPATIATKREKGIALPEYIEGSKIIQTPFLTVETTESIIPSSDFNLNVSLDRIDFLNAKTDKTPSEQQELNNLTNQVADKYPTSATSYDASGNPQGIDTEQARKIVGRQVDKFQSQINDLEKELNSYQLELQKKDGEFVKEVRLQGKTGTEIKSFEKLSDSEVADRRRKRKEIQDKIDKIKKQISKTKGEQIIAPALDTYVRIDLRNKYGYGG